MSLPLFTDTSKNIITKSASAAWTALGGGDSGKHADSYFVKAISSTDNYVPRFNGANGQLQTSKLLIEDTGYLKSYNTTQWTLDWYIFHPGATTKVAELYFNSGDATNITTGLLFWRLYSPLNTAANTTTGYHETYSLPAVAKGLLANQTYSILTSKNTVTIAQGGTGIAKTNPHKVLIGSTSTDTTSTAAPTWRTLEASDIPDISDTYATNTVVNGLLATADAMVFKGVLSGAATSENSGAGTLTPTADRGWTYKVDTDGYINGLPVEIGDILICTTDNTPDATTDGENKFDTDNIRNKWVIIQNNVDGAIFRSTNSFTDGLYIVADGANGKVKSQALPVASTDTAGIIKIGTDATNAMAGNTTITHVNQNTTTTSSWRKVILSGGDVYTALNTAVSNRTNVVYQAVGISALPSTGTLAATIFLVDTTSTKLYNNYLTFNSGGGWYMSDTTWIRTYGSKSVYMNAGTFRCDGIILTRTLLHVNAGINVDGDWITGVRGTAPTATTIDGTTTYSDAVIGTSILTLGNNKIGANSASGVAENAKGYLRIYGASSGYGELTYNDAMFQSNKSIYLSANSDSGIANELRGKCGTNDYWRVAGGATASNNGYMEIATADDSNEPIYARLYSGTFKTIIRTATLLDASGNTTFPGTVTATTFYGALSGNVTGEVYFGPITKGTSKGILTYSTAPKYGIWYYNDDTDKMILDAHGKADSATEADLCIVGDGALYNRNYRIPHTNNTTGTVGAINMPVYVNAGAITECTPYALRRIKLGDTVDNDRVVIGLCELSAANTSICSNWHGRIYRVRSNGLVKDHYVDININAGYATANGFFYSMVTNAENTDTTALLGSGYRACVFKYNNKYYGGLEYFLVLAATFYSDGVGTATPFVIAYYNNGTVKNEEIKNSLTYNTTQCDRATDNYYGYLEGTISTTENTSDALLLIGVTSDDTTTLKRDTNLTITNNKLSAVDNPLYLNSGSSNSLIFQRGGTTVGAFSTANNLVIGYTNSTDWNAVTDKLYINGTSYLNGNTTIHGNLAFDHTGSSTNGYVTWNSGTYLQQLRVTDDSTNNTAVFTFQQSSNSGTNYIDLFTIKDNGSVEIGSRVVTTAPSSETDVNRIIIIPYYHTGGPWKIISADNNTNAFLKLTYGSTDLMKIRNDGTIMNCLKIIADTAKETAMIEITNSRTAANQTAGDWYFASKYLLANAIANTNIIHILGKAASSKNWGYIGYHYADNSSDNSYLTFGFYGVNHVVKIFPTGLLNITQNITSSSTSTGSLVVAGGTGIAGTLYVGAGANITGQTVITRTNAVSATGESSLLIIKNTTAANNVGIELIRGSSVTATYTCWQMINKGGYLLFMSSYDANGSAASTAYNRQVLKLYPNTGNADLTGIATIAKIKIGTGTTDIQRRTISVTDTNLIFNAATNLGFIFLENAVTKVRLMANKFYPETTNTGSLGLTANRWGALYVGTADSYGNADTPIYWNNGVPAPASVVRMIGWSFDNGSTGTTLSHTSFTTDTIVITIVVSSGENYLTAPITWTSANGSIVLNTTTATTGAVTGYIIVAQGNDLTGSNTVTSSAITPTSQSVSYPLANGQEF